MSILHRFFTPDILEREYIFSPSGIYYAPEEGIMQDYRDYIAGLPQVEEPEIFGMHENANITFQNKETNAILNTALICNHEKLQVKVAKVPMKLSKILPLRWQKTYPLF
jgi:dynein heavy chain